MKKILKKYQLNFDDVYEKNIIYFCRSELNDFYKKQTNYNEKMKKIYENDIYEIIEKKYQQNLQNWDWYKQDIDKNIILTYPIHHNSIKLVELLLEMKDNNTNKKIYDLEIFREDISNALCSCINIRSFSMLDFLLEKNIHKNYISDMIYICHIMINRVSPENQKKYQKQLTKLLTKEFNLERILEKTLKSLPFNEEESIETTIQWIHLLEKEPNTNKELIFQNINKILNDLTFLEKLEKKQMKKSIQLLNDWMLAYNLKKELKPAIKQEIKNKI